MSGPRILALAGSARKDSFNAKLVGVAAEGAREVGAEVTILDLAEYSLPLFDEDLERDDGTPENASRLKELFLGSSGLLIASPEYNSSITPLLKNVIDWISRPVEGEPRQAAYQGKVAAIMSASPGALGGLRGLVHVRSILSSIGVIVLPNQVSIPNAHDAFDEAGQLKDERKQASVKQLGVGVATMIAGLQSAAE